MQMTIKASLLLWCMVVQKNIYVIGFFSAISSLNVPTFAPWVLGGDFNDFLEPLETTSVIAQAFTRYLQFRD